MSDVKMLLTPTIKNINVDRRTVKFVGTKETKDRTGDVVEVNGWMLDNFQKNPVFLWDHNPHLPPIGKVLSIIKEGISLVFEVEFAKAEINAFAETVFQLYKEGFLSAVSVGFIPKEFDLIRDSKTEEITGLRFTKQELLELSGVSIPAHQDALAFGGDKELQTGYQKLVEMSYSHPKLKTLMDVEEYHTQKILELKTLDEGDEQMKEEFEKLQAELAELKAQVGSLITLRESVELTKSAMDTLNKSVVTLLKAKEVENTNTAPSVAPVSVPQGPTLDVKALTDILDGIGKRIQEKSFKPKGA